MSDYENEIADHANYGKAKKFMHVTKNGDSIALSKLEDSHLQNIINFLQRKAKEGVKVRYGGGTTADDIWYDEDMLYGEEALKHLHYGEYVAEQKRRLTQRAPDAGDSAASQEVPPQSGESTPEVNPAAAQRR